MTYTLAVTSQGQVSIPAKVRKLWGLVNRGQITLTLQGKKAIIEPARDILDYVLRKVYRVDKDKIVDNLSLIIGATYLDVENRSEWSKSLSIYLKNNIDLIDSFLYVTKLKYDMKILTFDKDFKKIKS